MKPEATVAKKSHHADANDDSDDSDDHYDKIAEAPKLPNPLPVQPPPKVITNESILILLSNIDVLFTLKTLSSEQTREPKRRLTKRESAPAATAPSSSSSPSKGKSSPTRNLANRYF